MASTYKHGVYVSEQATSVTAPIEATSGLQVVVGTAPINLVLSSADDAKEIVNQPILAYTYKEAVSQLGFSYEFNKYTLCHSIYASFQVEGVAPIVLINVLDPTKHVTDYTLASLAVADKTATIKETGILAYSLIVKNGDTTLTNGTDYTTEFDDDGYVTIAFTSDATITSVTVTGKKLDPSAVTADDIIGGIDTSSGEETGIEAIRKVYPKLGLTPGMMLAPYYSKYSGVASALQAKTEEMNGVFRVFCAADIDSSSTGATKYTDVKTQKEAQGLNKAQCMAGWLYGKVGDYLVSPSALMAAKLAHVDALLNDIPYDGLDNQTISISAACLEDGTEVLLDQEQCNTVNSYGVCTFLNLNGWRTWGNNTCAYPSSTDPKDRWISIRRFMNWAANTFILTYFQKVGRPMSKRNVYNIVDSENIRGAAFVKQGIVARYEIEFNEDENPTTDLINGKVTFHQYISPFPPMEDIEDVIEYDADAVTSALTA